MALEEIPGVRIDRDTIYGMRVAYFARVSGDHENTIREALALNGTSEFTQYQQVHPLLGERRPYIFAGESEKIFGKFDDDVFVGISVRGSSITVRLSGVNGSKGSNGKFESIVRDLESKSIVPIQIERPISFNAEFPKEKE